MLTRDLPLQRIEEKDREIKQAQQKLAVLKQHYALIQKKTRKLKKFEDFLKSVQARNIEEYPELYDILQRYYTLADSYASLTVKHQTSGKEIDDLISRIEQVKRQRGDESLNLTNQIGEVKNQLTEVEAEKAALLIGNQEKTEKTLAKTNEHG